MKNNSHVNYDNAQDLHLLRITYMPINMLDCILFSMDIASQTVFLFDLRHFRAYSRTKFHLINETALKGLKMIRIFYYNSAIISVFIDCYSLCTVKLD